MQKKPELRVFLDTNVIFSGLYSSAGPAGIIVERFINGEFTVVISQQVLEEVVRTIKEKLPVALPALRTLLESVALEIVNDPAYTELVRWKHLINSDDAAILAAAEAAQPDYLVTGDKHFLDNPAIIEKSGLCIVSPARFLDHLNDRSSP
jgi:putative PIN family toxin of toxin-antitoxin system